MNCRLCFAALLLPVCPLLAGCGNNGCGLALQKQIELASATSAGVDLLGCCGDTRSLKVTLDSADIDSVDVANGPVVSGHVDAFLTDATCDRLFTRTYNGTGTAPTACRVYLGPVSAGTVSARQSIPRGNYTLIVQAWDSNLEPVRYDATVGVYSSGCRLQGTVGPTL